MKKISDTVVFFGSGPVAAEALTSLLQDFEVEAVITKPNIVAKPGELSVLQIAHDHHLKTFTPSNKTELDELIDTRPVKSYIAVLVDYGIIVSQVVIDYFPRGIVNSHFSLLPLWRGADPITFAILSGDKQTGVSLMLINPQMDEGLLLASQSIKIDESYDSPRLTKELLKLSHELIKHNLPKYLAGEITPYPQPSDIKPTYSRKLVKQDGLIDWTKSASELDRQIRAFINWPKSYTKFAELEIIVTKAHVSSDRGKPGEIGLSGSSITVYCGSGSLVIERLKPAGKPEMDAKAFLAGYRQLFN